MFHEKLRWICRNFLMPVNAINAHKSAVKPDDSLEVKNTFVNSVYYVTNYNICTFLVRTIRHLNKLIWRNEEDSNQPDDAFDKSQA